MVKKIFIFLWGHKIVSLLVLLIVISGSYFTYQKISTKEDSLSYVTSKVEKGLLVSSISGTGQVSASNQVEIKPKVSGDIVSVNVKVGQAIKQGDLIAQIDARDAARKVVEARASLENAKLDLEELLAPADDLTLIQAKNALCDAEDSLTKLKTTQANNYQETIEAKQKAEDNLEKAYEDAYNEVADLFLDLPDIVTGLYTVLFSDEISETESSVIQGSNNSILIQSVIDYNEKYEFIENYLDKAEDDYKLAEKNYNESFNDYKDTSRYSEKTIIEELLEETLETTKKVADTIKSETNMLDWWVKYRTDEDFKIYSGISGYQSDLSSYTSQTNSHLSSLLSAQRSIEDYKESISESGRDLAEMEQNQPLEMAAAERTLAEKKQKLDDLESGATELEIKSKQLTVQQKENSLIEAQQDYSNYFVRAPFDAAVAEVNVVKGDSASSSSAIATLISEQKIAEVTLNEIDAAQVEVGQKASLTFDAVADLSITGGVVEVDTLGTVSSGVVSYDVKIAFDVQDERVKPGMSVGVNIITESKANVLLAPINAVKTMGSGSYVEVLADGQIQKKTVTIGSSNDTMIEIIDGLEEGEEIITQTVSSSTTGTSQTQSSDRDEGPPGGMGMMMLR